MPQAAIAQSIAVAAMPTFSAQVARGEISAMRASLASALRAVLLLALPASLGLILLRTPLVALFYQGGSFGERDTQLVAWALLWYAAGLVGHSLVEICSRAFYALHNTRTPVTVGVAAMTLNIILSLTLPAWFSRLGWLPHGGLALANSLATTLEAVVLLILLRRRLDGIGGRVLLRGAGAALVATLAMSAALWGWLILTAGQGRAVLALGGAALGILVYAAVLLALRVDEPRRVIGFVMRRLQR